MLREKWAGRVRTATTLKPDEPQNHTQAVQACHAPRAVHQRLFLMDQLPLLATYSDWLLVGEELDLYEAATAQANGFAPQPCVVCLPMAPMVMEAAR